MFKEKVYTSPDLFKTNIEESVERHKDTQPKMLWKLEVSGLNLKFDHGSPKAIYLFVGMPCQDSMIYRESWGKSTVSSLPSNSPNQSEC